MRIANHQLLTITLMALFLTGCEVTDAGLDKGEIGARDMPGWLPVSEQTPSTPAAPMISTSFDESSDDDLMNPERGFYMGYDVLRPDTANRIRAAGMTLAISVVKLRDFRAAPISSTMLAQIDAGLTAARAHGFKVVLRFSYNSDFEADAPLSIVLTHIEQLRPLLREHADVISVMQAGFIGAWGEWHSSTNGLDDSPPARQAILDALLEALPATRNIQIRAPKYKIAHFPGGAITAAEAYTGSARARVGHHNDCFLASNSDYGTYDSPSDEQLVWADGKYTAIGGETCAVFPTKTDCAPALVKLERGHWSYLNSQYHQTVLANWVTQGCSGEIHRRLGYRFSLARVAHTEAVAPGGELAVEVDVRNSGFAAPYNYRPVELVLSNGADRHVIQLVGRDARRWAAGETTTLSARVRIPGDAAVGAYSLHLRLPDESAALADDPRYSVQLANDGVFDPETGDNLLSDTILVDNSAGGPRVIGARGFTEIL